MMGKARKHSRGKSSGFVPDYTEPDEIEEAPAPKRSRYSLNGTSYDGPKEVLSLSRMSRPERKNLVRKLKMELEQVRDLRKKLASFSSDSALFLPDSDIHSCSDGTRRPPQGKKRLPVRNDKHRTKKGPSQRSEFARSDVPRSSVASLMKECETLLDRLWSHKKGGAFRTPVDPVLLNIPDYFTVIKHPMDLGTIRSRLRRDEYSSPLDFAADVRLTFSNSMLYNSPGNQYHIMARDLSTYFESRWKIIEKKIPVIEPPVMSLTSSASLESEIPNKGAPPREKAAAVNESKLRVESAKLSMTDGEKRKLSQDLEALEEEFPQNIIDLLSKQSCRDGQSGEIEIEIDLDTLSDEILFMVRKLLDDYLREKKKSQEKSEPCEMEIVYDSGFSNSTMQPSKGDVHMDEDVDIVGGNDPPVSSHPPLKIEKDDACRNNECNSPSSSSSDSGSSSSDSESCSSSGSETDSIKASNPTSAEDKKKQGVGINRKDDDVNGERIVVNDSLNQLGQGEHDVGETSTAMDAVDVLPDEETALPERQISPGKAYRAVLLKNRFADTIMKAREKSLAKGEKGDPEKLRIEREEFEKRLREEKVRLQAEAKAAEDARRKAEAEAAEKARKAEAEAAEKARRDREQEREAARQALQKMEKTVEINEGMLFMEDLEMLRATSLEGDQLPTFMEEMSPKFSQDMLGSFKMEGNSNPLEQLGLYMKMDEDEDDEEDQPYLSQGEIDEQQSLDRKEVEGDEKLVTRSEEPVSQMAQDNGNAEDEKPVNHNEGEEQMENVPLSPHGEEGEDQLVSGNEGREDPLSQKAQDDGNHEDEKLINHDEGKEQFENVAEQENGIVDKGEQETAVVNMGEEEAKVVDKREEEAEVVVDKGEEKPEVVDSVEQETVVDMGEEDTEVVDKGEEETDIVNMGENMGEQGNGVVEKGEQGAEVVDREEEETGVLEKGEEETEVVEREID
ncbi:unnamed protein product [Microthlaspi erraticum]|uniref:Bromo domain-containing protein n=1 Tax=Microthlaspi erraticum TaxID=1685480 RepID=A0A6D2J247_9BRAS|nr:unnamed protein product [Microthlaspi erraticum]